MNEMTTSLAMSKKLLDAGWKSKSPFFWTFSNPSRNKGPKPRWALKCSGLCLRNWMKAKSPTSKLEIIAAPTAEEILRELPKIILQRDEELDVAILPKTLNISPELGKWLVTYSHPFERISADNLADAAANMWIHLKENKLL